MSFIKNDYTKNHKLLDYVKNFANYRYAYEKGFMDANHDINIVDIFDNFQNKEADIMIDQDINDNEWITYEFNPKKMSQDLYGTVDLWRVLLQENNMNHPGQFCKLKTLRIPDPVKFKKFVSSIYEIKNEYMMKIDRIW